ncbi:MAG: ankyrin repeat domain-containing protein [Verrucomicrobiota bacterium]|nr:ankyrin repeat domain-containing protein [Verrucomicrobiota bacterium]
MGENEMKHLLITTIATVLLVGCATTQSPGISIHDAAIEGNVKAVKQYLATGTDVELRCKSCGGTALNHAVQLDRNAVVELLIKADADVNAKDKSGMTPLHTAAWKGHKEAAELLIAKGANVNDAKNETGSTPMHWVASYGRKELAELLIDNGANVNAKIPYGLNKGETPLDFATHPDNVNASSETADLLRKHGGKTGEELKAERK